QFAELHSRRCPAKVTEAAPAPTLVLPRGAGEGTGFQTAFEGRLKTRNRVRCYATHPTARLE
ncbi:hypothetical protein HMPREF9120_02618, partial [Neisseria sp. oral taxon 020 str. F0370]